MRKGVLHCFENTGQSCNAPTRMLVHESIYEQAVSTAVRVGEGVEVGDRVIAQMSIGGLAEIVKVPATSVWKAPDAVHLSRCANLGRNFFAAYHSLKTIGEVGADALVLVDGASGGVGMAAVELAKAMGARVIAGVSVPEKMELPMAAGADRVFCYGRDRQSHRGFKNKVKQAAAELLINSGADLKAKDNDGRTLLHLMAFWMEEKTILHMIIAKEH